MLENVCRMSAVIDENMLSLQPYIAEGGHTFIPLETGLSTYYVTNPKLKVKPVK